jgi:transcriptional antiterminator Rof (Rho-off)
VSDYRVIDCDLHDLYEISILRRRRLLLNWRDETGLSHLELLLPIDLETVSNGEFLIASDTYGASVRIRLDRILHARDPASGEEFPTGP